MTSTATYELRVAGHLDDHWSACLGDLTLIRRDDGTTSLTGPLADQAQLHGVLATVRDMGVTLLSLQAFDPEAGQAEPSPPTPPAVLERPLRTATSPNHELFHPSHVEQRRSPLTRALARHRGDKQHGGSRSRRIPWFTMV